MYRIVWQYIYTVYIFICGVCMWFVVRTRVRGGMSFLRSLVSNNRVKQLYAKVVYRVTIYAVEVDGDGLVLNSPYELVLKTESLELGDGWEEIKVIERTLRHRRYGYLRVVPFLRVGGVEAPLHPIKLSNYDYEFEESSQDLDLDNLIDF